MSITSDDSLFAGGRALGLLLLHSPVFSEQDVNPYCRDATRVAIGRMI